MEGTSGINKLVEEKAQQLAAQQGSEGPGKTDSHDDKDENIIDPDKPGGDGGDDGGGDGGGTETPEAKAEREKLEAQAEAQKQIDKLSQEKVAGLIKEYGFDTEDELKEFLANAKKPAKTEEEKKKEEDLYAANLNSYAIQSGLMKLEDINQLNKLRSEDDEVLVFEKFTEEIREEILDDMPEDASEQDIQDRLKEEFEKAYPLDSKNKKAKQRAEEKIAREAKAIRAPLESSFKSAKEKYDDELAVRNEYPQYQKSMNKILDTSVPSKFSFYEGKEGEEDVKVEIDVSEDVKKEILETVRKNIVDQPETFLKHKKGQSEDLKNAVNQHVEYLLWQKLNQEGKKQMHEKLVSLGRRTGSNAGADNSFANNQAGAGSAAATVDPSKQVLDSTRKK